jgi:restriction system protein
MAPRKTWRRRRRPRLPSVDQIFDRIQFADAAIKKLYLGSDLSDEEMSALFASDYVQRVDAVQEKGIQTVYKSQHPVTSPVLVFPDVEKELLLYFARHPEQLRLVPPRKFEELIAAVFKNNGFEVELTPQTRDGGVDILAIRRSLITGPTLHLVECKRHDVSNPVGLGIVQRMLGVVEGRRATQGIIVTTSTFTKDARDFAAASSYRLSLRDYDIIAAWLREFEVPTAEE